MAVITKIRNRSALLITVIGVAMALFVLSDLLGSGSGLLQQRETTVAEIRGEKVSYQEFEQMVQQEIGNENLDEQAREQVRSRVWNMLLQEKIMYEEYEDLGLSVSPEELFYQIQNTGPNSVVNQYFTNPQTGQIYEQFRDPATGGLNSQRVIAYVRQMLESDQAKSWIPVERAIKMDRLSAKYYALIKKGLNPTSVRVQDELKARNTKANFNYVSKNYAAIDDAKVEITESDLENYYDEHSDEKQYQQEETKRGIEYVVFNVEPTANDVATILEEVKEIKPKFAGAEDDTLFVNDFADTPFNINYFRRGELPETIDSIAFKMVGKDTVLGPYRHDGFYKLSKVIGRKVSSDSVEARHILLPVQQGQDTAEVVATADSLRDVIRERGNFEQMATLMSQDKQSAQKGGDLGWVTEGQMVKPFNDSIFAGEPGDMPIVQTRFGVHLIEVMEKTKPVEKVLVATIDREVSPSKTTFDSRYKEANKFSLNNNTQQAFRKAGAEYGIEQAPSVGENDKTLGQLDSPRPLIRWAFESGKGDVSEPFEMEGKFVVACLTSIKEKGTLPLEEVKEQVRAEVLNEKKAEMIKAEIVGKTSLTEIAQIWGTEVQNVPDLSYSAYSIPGIGPEGGLIGKIFAMEPGQTSKPIAGKRGVYIVELIDFTEAQEANEQMVLSDLQRGYNSRVDFEAFNALKEHANIEDNRGKFY